jgi:hypothetical protein
MATTDTDESEIPFTRFSETDQAIARQYHEDTGGTVPAVSFTFGPRHQALYTPEDIRAFRDWIRDHYRSCDSEGRMDVYDFLNELGMTRFVPPERDGEWLVLSADRVSGSYGDKMIDCPSCGNGLAVTGVVPSGECSACGAMFDVGIRPTEGDDPEVHDAG